MRAGRRSALGVPGGKYVFISFGAVISESCLSCRNLWWCFTGSQYEISSKGTEPTEKWLRNREPRILKEIHCCRKFCLPKRLVHEDNIHQSINPSINQSKQWLTLCEQVVCLCKLCWRQSLCLRTRAARKFKCSKIFIVTILGSKEINRGFTLQSEIYDDNNGHY